MAINMTSTSSDTVGKDEISNQELSKFSNHHAKTGCNGEVKSYKDEEGRIKGMFCASCKEEWLREIPNINVAPGSEFKSVPHHYVPTFYRLRVSDTGHYVRWKDIHKLKRGDHVAWNRPLPYWHHGIVTKDVEEGEDELSVIEYCKVKCCTIGIRAEKKNKGDVTGCCCCSQMYKVVYPKEVEDQNPPDLVMLRAYEVKELGNDYSIFFDNCEHFATFCKTGSHKCNQLFQYKASIGAWGFRLFVAFIHIVVVVFFSETIEFLVPTIDKDYLAVIVIIVLEVLYLVLVIFITYKKDTPREGFKRKDKINYQSGCTLACRRAAIKSVMQYSVIIGFVALFGIYFVRVIGRHKNIEQWSVKKRVGIEMGMGIAGGIVGYIIGYIFIHFIPWWCCRTNIGQDKDTEKGVTDAKRAKGKSLSPTLPSEGTNKPGKSAEAVEISALPPRKVVEEGHEIIMPSLHTISKEVSSSVNEGIETQAL